MMVTPRHGDEAPLVHCHAGCEQPNLFAAFCDLDGDSAPNANGRGPAVKSSGPADHRYEYWSATGELIATKLRWDATRGRGKRFAWKPAGIETADLLYGAERLSEYPTKIVLVVEGEKCVDAAHAAGITCPISGAAGATPSREALAVLAGRTVLLFGDNDSPGRKLMDAIAGNLPGDCAVRLVTWPDAPAKGDVVDFIEAHQGDAPALLRRLLNQAPPYMTPEPDAPAGFDLSSVAPESINWLWCGHIPIGKMTLFDGDPGLGKSVMALDIAARVTTGRDMPDGSSGGPPAYVVVLTAEDGIADTVRPRADAAGADCSRIRIIEDFPDKDGEHSPSIPGDIDALERVIRQTGAKLVILDPLSAYLGSEGGDGNNDPKVRRALAPLAKMAERTGVAVILVRHLVKDSDKKALYRGGGSIGIIGASRAAYVVAEDNEGDDNDRVIAPTKFNLGPKPEALKFSTESAVVGDIETVRIAWRGRSLQTADSLLAGPPEPQKLQEAIDFIEAELATARVEAKTMLSRAKAAGIAEKTLRRAFAKVGVKTVKSGMVDGWFWELPKAVRGEVGHGGNHTPPTPKIDHLPIADDHLPTKDDHLRRWSDASGCRWEGGHKSVSACA